MRVIGRYFAIGATLGSVSGLVALVLIWTWMTVHLGLLGFLVGWIPAGLIAAAIWLTMVIFWGPILIVCAMISLALLLIRSHPERAWSSREPPPASEPEPAPVPPEAETPRETGQFAGHAPEGEPPPTAAPSPLQTPLAPPDQPVAGAPPAPGPAPQPSAAPRARPSEDLGGDAAAAGDTSRRPPR